MDIETLRSFCLAKTGVNEELPFDQDTLVFKVMGKMFALTDIELFQSINLKCNPENAQDLRERYHAVLPGYHMNKKHWNTVIIDGSIPDKILLGWIEDSYALVVAGLTRKTRQELNELDQ